MPWGSSSESALKGQGSQENRTNMKETFVKDIQNRKKEQSKKGTQENKKNPNSFLRYEKEKLAII